MLLLSASRWDGSLWIKLAAALAVIAVADRAFWYHEQYGGTQGLIGLAMVAALALARPAVRRSWRARIALAAAACFALAQVWDPALLHFVLFWIAIGMATLLPGTARFDDGWRWFQRLWAHGFKSLFGPLIDLLILGKVRRKRPSGAIGLRRVLPVLALPLAGGLVFAALFAKANPVIAGWLDALSLPSFDWDLLPRLIVAGIIGVMTWGVLRARPPRRMFATLDATGDIALPGFSPAAITLSLVVFNALFAVQNLLDLSYLTGLARLPGGITLAEYAHRGAYPLVVTALLAALFVMLTSRPGSALAASPTVRALVSAWIVQNVVLVLSAAFRTWDYVEAYSLTPLRIAALAWTALVALGLVLVLVRMLRGKSLAWLINANLAAAGALLALFCLIDTNAVSANWNVRHAREFDGTGAALDLCYLQDLGPDALPALDHLARTGKLTVHTNNLRAWAQDWQENDLESGWWTWQGERRLAASLALGRAHQKDTFDRSCYGNDLRD